MRKALSFRLPEATVKLLVKLVKETGMTQTQVLIIALERMGSAKERKK